MPPNHHVENIFAATRPCRGWRRADRDLLRQVVCIRHMAADLAQKDVRPKPKRQLFAAGDMKSRLDWARQLRGEAQKVRRTAAQLQARCELCVRPGRMRVFGIKTRVLCAECYAPRGLERDVNRLLDDGRARPDSHPILFEADLPERVRALVQPGTWRQHRDTRGYVVRYLLREDCRDWQNLMVSITERSGRAAM